MRTIYSNTAKDDIKKHASYIRKIKKSDGHKYQDYEISGINNTLKKKLQEDIRDKDEHNKSIFPDKYEYGHSNYKMHIDKESHYIVFYKITKTKKGTEYATIEKCIHSIELKKELDKKNIKPLKSTDPKLLLDYTIVEKEDKVKADELSEEEREEYKKKEDELKDRIEVNNKKKSKSKSKTVDKEDDDEGEKAEVTDPDTGETVKKKKHKGERGGYYYLNDEGTRIYPPEWNKHQKKNESKSLNSLSNYIDESINFVSLSDYIKQHISVNSN